MAEVRIGRKWRSHVPNEVVAKEITNSLLGLAFSYSVDKVQKRGEEIATAMTRAGNRELMKIGPFIADQLMGLQSRTRGYTESRRVRAFYPKVAAEQDAAARNVVIPARLFQRGMPKVSKTFRIGRNAAFAADKLPTNELKWKPLSLKTERAKRKKSNPSGFFTDTLALQQFFRESASDIIANKSGGVQVTFHKEKIQNPDRVDVTFREVIGALEIKAAPKKITAYNLPALVTGNWTDVNERMTLEKALFPAGIVRKLGLKPGGAAQPFFRPLVQPTLAFWLLYRVPRALAASMVGAMRRATPDGAGHAADTFSSGGK